MLVMVLSVYQFTYFRKGIPASYIKQGCFSNLSCSNNNNAEGIYSSAGQGITRSLKRLADGVIFIEEPKY